MAFKRGLTLDELALLLGLLRRASCLLFRLFRHCWFSTRGYTFLSGFRRIAIHKGRHWQKEIEKFTKLRLPIALVGELKPVKTKSVCTYLSIYSQTHQGLLIKVCSSPVFMNVLTVKLPEAAGVVHVTDLAEHLALGPPHVVNPTHRP
jgi:hypothetical protein